MIQVVPDTNTLIKGLYSAVNTERQLINLVHMNKVSFYGSQATFQEFCETVKNEKFKSYLHNKRYTPEKLIADYEDLVILDKPSDSYKDLKVSQDEDDDEFIRVALTSGSRIIISHDKHLLNLGSYKDIKMVKPEEFMNAFNQ